MFGHWPDGGQNIANIIMFLHSARAYFKQHICGLGRFHFLHFFLICMNIKTGPARRRVVNYEILMLDIKGEIEMNYSWLHALPGV